jgi:hypothetical protein
MAPRAKTPATPAADAAAATDAAATTTTTDGAAPTEGAATEAAGATIPVRLTIVVQVDPAKWTMPEAPAALDTAKLLAALTEQGIAAELAQTMVDAAAKAAQPKTDGNTAVRAAMRAHMLATLRADATMVAAGATITETQRAGKE